MENPRHSTETKSSYKHKYITTKNCQSYNHPSHHPVLYAWESCTQRGLQDGDSPALCCQLLPLPHGGPCSPPPTPGLPHLPSPPPLLFFCQGRLWPLFHTPWPCGTLPPTPSPTRMKQIPLPASSPLHALCSLLSSRQKVRTPATSSFPCCTL